MVKLPPLRAVQYFESVARLNSFSNAAHELNVTQSAVSHQIRLLEEYLGEALFMRQGRLLELTQLGEHYLEEVGPALASISKASQQMREGTKGQIRLAVYSSLAVKWLVPKLEDWRRQHPDIDLTLNMVAGDPAQTDQEGDCFITVQPPARNFVSELLFKEVLYPVCSQKIWREIEGLPLPEAMWNYPLLSANSIFVEKGGDWIRWGKAGNVIIPNEVDMQHFSHVLLTIEAARYDQGITLINDYQLSESDREFGFKRIPSHVFETGDSFHFTYKKSRQKQAEMIKLSRWLKQLCEDVGDVH
ncbi:LysR family transcriptional regulator [Echinimonas agarilytica]|uniref:LysR family transcriptional regulator n=1 Tax=Echinimonas agarilytica TaxID=1215918 RepID=A0AA42B7L3_9GAMM|nr:LysR family transcriptional regulator [Echinimonas agarilytica]MCM2680290.1 LysR family transcriptional regulator [Echinimonas agarilytica]